MLLSGDPNGERVHGRTCPLCEAMCGLTVPVTAEGTIGTIRGDRDDPWSKGFICPKGSALGRLHEDPDRVRTPLIRDGDSFREATWDEAFRRCEELIGGVLERHGTEATASYIGNPVAHNFSYSRYGSALINATGRWYSPGTIDTWPRNVASLHLYGNAWLIPVPDIERTDLFVVFGANPQASNGSLFSCPDIMGEIERIRSRGGRTIVVDPRRTGTAAKADQWIPIRPGGDAALLLAVLHVLVDEDRVDAGAVAHLVDGLDRVTEIARRYPPERVEDLAGVPADAIRDLAHQLADAPSAAIYGRIGLCNQEYGTLASWLIDVVAICSGHFDRVGGSMFADPINTVMSSLAPPDTDVVGRWHSRVRGVPEVLDQIPVGLMAEEITTPGDGQLKALVILAGNPVVSAPQSNDLDAALPQLECLISIDNYVNETSRHADVILPGTTALETPFFDAMYQAWSVRKIGRWSDRVLPHPDGWPEDWETLLTLQGLLSGQRLDDVDVQATDDVMFDLLCAAKGIDPEVARPLSPPRGPERLTDWSIRTGSVGDRYGEAPDGWTLEKLKAHPHGVDLGPMVPRAAGAVRHPDGRIRLAPDYIVADLDRLDAALDAERPDLVLVSRRHLRSNNSWMHNITVLVKGKDRCTLLVHPDDAGRLGLTDGEAAQVTSSVGSLEVPVEVSDEMMPGVVCLPHGWGHDKAGTRLSIAREHAGVNSNELLPADFCDPLSNNVAVNGVPVEVAPA
ncbi:molybdopterin oxidoreductase family protein [Rhabdothermincola salaria]|uniref:molybdopterin oxidoreductase family protein n=1 Tax=Rhabdothermincola salaria TaxID=2903142 RepID=UPI001E310497|nr:molybdopterin oxidoreductase family protein [Rhabdothermincola salaria]MCD9623965.1 molybdopterin oxidoreductase family protein [Rhabdothermincola salaria]